MLDAEQHATPVTGTQFEKSNSQFEKLSNLW